MQMQRKFFAAHLIYFLGRRIYHKFVMYVQAKTIWQTGSRLEERFNETQVDKPRVWTTVFDGHIISFAFSASKKNVSGTWFSLPQKLSIKTNCTTLIEHCRASYQKICYSLLTLDVPSVEFLMLFFKIKKINLHPHNGCSPLAGEKSVRALHVWRRMENHWAAFLSNFRFLTPRIFSSLFLATAHRARPIRCLRNDDNGDAPNTYGYVVREGERT